MKRVFWLIALILAAGCAFQRATNVAPPAAPARIDQFEGEYRFLSNFYPATVVFEGITYPDSEHAYQSAKTLDMNERRRIAALSTPAEAKHAGEALQYRADWPQVKYRVMLACVRDKFTRNQALRAKLLATGDAYLEEGNTWGDRIWGVYQGQGTNWLGKILMQVRSELRQQRSQSAGCVHPSAEVSCENVRTGRARFLDLAEVCAGSARRRPARRARSSF